MSKGTTQPGYINRNRQQVIAATGRPGNDHCQSLYEMECLNCGCRYDANGSDIFQRKCPHCQGGRPSSGSIPASAAGSSQRTVSRSSPMTLSSTRPNNAHKAESKNIPPLSGVSTFLEEDLTTPARLKKWIVEFPDSARFFEDVISRAIYEKPALAGIAISLQRLYVASCPLVKTATVSWDNYLVISLDFLKLCTASNIEFVLLQQFLHKALLHTQRHREMEDIYFSGSYSEMKDIATKHNSASDTIQEFRELGHDERKIKLFFAFSQISSLAAAIPVNRMISQCLPVGVIPFFSFDKTSAAQLISNPAFSHGKNISPAMLQFAKKLATPRFLVTQGLEACEKMMLKECLELHAVDVLPDLSYEQYFNLLIDIFDENYTDDEGGSELLSSAIDTIQEECGPCTPPPEDRHDASNMTVNYLSSKTYELTGNENLIQEMAHSDVDGLLFKPSLEMQDTFIAKMAAFQIIYEQAREKQRQFELSSPPGRGTTGLLAILPQLTQISNRKLWRKAINHSASLCAADDSWTECLLSRDRRDASPFGRRRDETHQHLVVVIDTSGSVVDSVNRFCGAIEVALRRENLTCDLILCHDQVSGHYRNIRSFKKLKINGATGGTDLRQAIKFISESSHYRKMRKIHVVMITDGYTPWNGVPDRFVLTCIYTPQHAALAGVRYSALIHQ